MPESEVFLQSSIEKNPERVSVQLGGVSLALHSNSSVLLNWLRSTFAAYSAGTSPRSRVGLRVLGPSQWRQARSELSLRGRAGAEEISAFDDCGDFLISFIAGDHMVLFEERTEHELSDLMSRVLARVLPHHGAVLFHAAGVSRNSRGYLFFGPRGAGKSTAVALIADMDPEVRILGDDVVIVQAPEWGAPMIHTAPFGCRYSRLAPPPMQVALDAAFRLVRDDTTRIEPLASDEAARFLREAAEPAPGEVLYDGPLEEKIRRILFRMSQSTGSGVRRLRFNRSAEFWRRVRA